MSEILINGDVISTVQPLATAPDLEQLSASTTSMALPIAAAPAVSVGADSCSKSDVVIDCDIACDDADYIHSTTRHTSNTIDIVNADDSLFMNIVGSDERLATALKGMCSSPNVSHMKDNASIPASSDLAIKKFQHFSRNKSRYVGESYVFDVQSDGFAEDFITMGTFPGVQPDHRNREISDKTFISSTARIMGIDSRPYFIIWSTNTTEMLVVENAD